jgi:hypothetical protein
MIGENGFLWFVLFCFVRPAVIWSWNRVRVCDEIKGVAFAFTSVMDRCPSEIENDQMVPDDQGKQSQITANDSFGV